MDKQVSIIVEGPSTDEPLKIVDLTLEPGVIVEEALEAADLTGYRLRTEAGDDLDEWDDLCDRAQDGEKLRAVPKMEVG